MSDANVSIPKVIYTYWHSDTIGSEQNPVVHACIESWKRHNPDHEVVILTPENIASYLPDVDIMALRHSNTHQRTADFVRLNMLRTYGGIWIDASIMVLKPLTGVHEAAASGYEYVGFYIDSMTSDQRYPIIENWFMASVPNSRFIQLWCKEFMRMNEFEDTADYVKEVTGLISTQKMNSIDYLTMHLACQMVLQHQGYSIDNLYMERAEDGPFRYLVENNWEPKDSVYAMCTQEHLHDPALTLVKFRGEERKLIESEGLLGCIARQQRASPAHQACSEHSEQ
jgi:hypothetical protein